MRVAVPMDLPPEQSALFFQHRNDRFVAGEDMFARQFRHFGFVGFKTDDDAKNAQKYFNGTFIGSSKISVEVCADLGDESKPR